MAIKVTLKNSVVQDSVPTTTHLAAVGELALNANINSLGIYMRASDNSIVKMAGPGSLTTPAASVTVAGIAELATSAETTTGTDAARVTTPAGVKAVTDAERTTSNSTYLAKAGGTLTGVLAATAGSNSAPAIHFGDSDSGIYGGTNTVSLAAGGTQGLTLNASAEVNVPVKLGVNTASPTKALHVTSTGEIARFQSTNSSATIRLYSTASDHTELGHTGDFYIAVGGSERARIDASGRLLVGHSSARAIANLTTLQQIEGTDAASGLSITRNSASNEGGTLNFGKSRAAAVGGVTVIQDGDALGTINFSGADGTDLTNTAASIAGFINGTPGANDTPGKLVFGTTADGAASPTTRLTIDSAGVVNVPDNGKFTAGASDDLQIYHTGSFSKIVNSTGDLNLYADTNVGIYNAAGSELKALFATNGAVKLYYANAKHFETTSTGVSWGTTRLRCADNGMIELGTSQDLQIYADGSNSYIAHNGDGNLRIFSGAAESIRCTEAGATSLFHNGTEQCYTHASGFKLNDSKKLLIGTGNDLQIYHDGTNNQILSSNGDIVNTVDTGHWFYIKTDAGNDVSLIAKPNAGVELYYDNVTTFETTSTGAKMAGAADTRLTLGSGGTDGTNDSVHVRADGANLNFMAASGGITKFEVNGTETLNIAANGNATFAGEIHLSSNGSLIKENQLKFSPAGTAYIDHGTNDQDINFRVSNSTVGALGRTALVIKSDGKVGIGTTSPGSLLELNAANDTAQLKFLRTGTTIGGTINTRDESGSKGLTYTAQDGNSAVPQHVFSTNDGSAVTERFRITHTGKIESKNAVQSGGSTTGGFQFDAVETACVLGIQQPSSGADTNAAIQLWDGTSNNLRINYSGLIKTSTGIQFTGQTDSSATGATTGDTTLDHYESGTWTPVLKQGANVITTTMNSSGSAATYTRIGNLVQLSLSINNETTAGNTGVSFAIQGLPFAASSNERQLMSGGIWYSTGLRLNGWPTMCQIGGGAAEINFYAKDSASGSYYTAEVSAVGANSYFFVSIVYRV